MFCVLHVYIHVHCMHVGVYMLMHMYRGMRMCGECEHWLVVAGASCWVPSSVSLHLFLRDWVSISLDLEQANLASFLA